MGTSSKGKGCLLAGIFYEHESSSSLEMYWNCLRANVCSPHFLVTVGPRFKSDYLRGGFVDPTAIRGQRAPRMAIWLRQLKKLRAPTGMAAIRDILVRESNLETRVCPHCAELGIHSTIFVLPHLVRCPVHDVQLVPFYRTELPNFQEAPAERRAVVDQLNAVGRKLLSFYSFFYRKSVPIRPFWGLRPPVQSLDLALGLLAFQSEPSLLAYLDPNADIRFFKVMLKNRRENKAKQIRRLGFALEGARTKVIKEVESYIIQEKKLGNIGKDMYCRTEDCVERWKANIYHPWNRNEFLGKIARRPKLSWNFRPVHMIECVLHSQIARRVDVSWVDDRDLELLVSQELIRSLSATNLYIKCLSAGLPRELEETYFWKLLPSRSPAALLLYDSLPGIVLQTYTVAEALEDVIPAAERMSRVRVVRDDYE